MKKTAIVISAPPYGKAQGREALDLALGLSMSQSITLFFLGDGVFHLRKDQRPSSILQRDYSAAFGLLDIYDIQQCYAPAVDLTMRAITDPLIDVTSKTHDEIIALLQEQEAILRF